MQKCLALIALATLISVSSIIAMNDNNAPTPDEKELLDSRIRAFTQNSRVLINQTPQARSPRTSDDERENPELKAKLAIVKSIRALEEERANEEAIACVYEEPFSENLDQLLDRIRNETDATERLLEQIRAERHLASSRSTLFPASNNNNINNNNNAPADPQDESDQSMRLAFEHEARMLQAQIIDEPTKSYELMLQFFRKNSKSLTVKTQSTGSSPLHEAIKDLQRVYDPRNLISLTALLEAGADKEALNDAQQTPLGLAFESENELLIQLMTAENPNKETLVNLAFEHNLQELIDILIA